MLHDITNFEIINEREMDGTIVVDNSSVLSSDDILIQVSYLIITFLFLVNYYQNVSI